MSARPRPDERTRLAEAELLTPGLLHEMRQPLMAIGAGLQLLAARLGDRAVALEEWELVTSQLGRLEELFETWTDLVHGRGATGLAFEVEPVVRRAADLLRFRLKRLGARFAVTADARAARAHGAPCALLHATTNLLANAIDAVDGTDGRVEIRVTPVGGAVQVRVADEGVGVAPEVRARIFEPRFTTKPDGTGLGLAIARGLVEASGGEVWLVPEDDPARRPWARTEFAISFGRGEAT